MKWELLKLAYIVGIAIGGCTASGYPPFDPSIWLMMFCIGGLMQMIKMEQSND
jgi:hypothetical protein